MVQSRRMVELPHVNGAVAATFARVIMISHVERRSVRRSTLSTTARHQRRALGTAVAAGRMGLPWSRKTCGAWRKHSKKHKC